MILSMAHQIWEKQHFVLNLSNKKQKQKTKQKTKQNKTKQKKQQQLQQQQNKTKQNKTSTNYHRIEQINMIRRLVAGSSNESVLSTIISFQIYIQKNAILRKKF